MQTPLVFKLSAMALMGLSLGAFAPFQDADDGADTPRPRLQLPRGFTSAAPSLGMFRAGETPKLGVMVEAGGDGILVKEVQDDSLAAAAGVQAGDLLLSLDGTRLAEVGDIARALAGVQPGASFALSVVREGAGLVKLEGTRPELKVEKPAPADGHRGAFLGVSLGEAADGGGVTVDAVHDGTAAWFATLEQGDVLTKVGDSAVNSAAEVASAVAALEPGSAVTLTWTRDGESHSNQVRLGHRGLRLNVAGNGADFPGFVIPQGNARGGSYFFGNGPQGLDNVMRFYRDGDDAGAPFFLHRKDHDGDVRFDVQRFQHKLDDIPKALEQYRAHGLPLHENFFSPDGKHNVLRFGGADGKVLDLHKVLKDAGVDLEELQADSKQLQIKLDGKTLEIVTDGDVQVHELDDADVDGASSIIYSYSSSAGAPAVIAPTATSPTVISKVRGLTTASPFALVTRDAGPFTVVTRSNTSCKVVCEPKPECEADCEADADDAVQIELVDPAPVAPASADDDDLL